MKVMVEQMDIVETLTPMSFNSFRDRLETASGFQSVPVPRIGVRARLQARRHAQVPARAGTPAHDRLERRLHEPSVVDAFYDFLEQHGVTIPAEVRSAM